MGALGAVAVMALLRDSKRLGEVRGMRFPALGTVVAPLFHPAYVIRNLDRNSEIEKLFRSDLRQAYQEAGLL